MNEKDFEFVNPMLEHLINEKKKTEYVLRQIEIQIKSLEDYKNKVLKGNKNG